MDKNIKLHLEVEINGKTYEFSAPLGAPLGEAHDALYQFLQEIVKLAQEAVKKAEAPADTAQAPKA
jgi:hypothetical protein